MQTLSKYEIDDEKLSDVSGGMQNSGSSECKPKFCDGDRVRTTDGKSGVIVGDGFTGNYSSGERTGVTMWYRIVTDNGNRLKYPEWELTKIM